MPASGGSGLVDVGERERVAMSRAAGWLLVGACASAMLLVAVPGEVSPGSDRGGWLGGPAAGVTGVLLLRYGRRTPTWLYDVLLALANLACAFQLLLIADSGRLLGGEVLFLPGVVFACAFLPTLRALPHLLFVAAAIAWVYRTLDEPAEIVTQRVMLVVGFFGMTGVLVGVLRRRLRELITELDDQARTDALTGLLNRRGTVEALQLALDLGRRQALPLSLVTADVDHFKDVNDAFGHPGGDDALTRVADVLRRTVRAHDHVGRLGGEEFALVLVGATSADAEALAARCAQALREAPVLPDGRGITMSYGIAEASPSSTATSLLRRSDDALYRAKRAGRDRACTATPEPAPLPGGAGAEPHHR